MEDEVKAWHSASMLLDIPRWRSDMAGAAFLQAGTSWRTFGDVAKFFRRIFTHTFLESRAALSQLLYASDADSELDTLAPRAFSEDRVQQVLAADRDLHFVLAQIASELVFIEHWFSHVQSYRQESGIHPSPADDHWSHHTFRILALDALAVEMDFANRCPVRMVRRWRRSYRNLVSRGDRDTATERPPRDLARLPRELYLCKCVAATNAVKVGVASSMVLPAPSPIPPPASLPSPVTVPPAVPSPDLVLTGRRLAEFATTLVEGETSHQLVAQLLQKVRQAASVGGEVDTTLSSLAQQINALPQQTADNKAAVLDAMEGLLGLKETAGA
jgi:hypothetical protein